MASWRFNVFISHVHEDDSGLQGIKDLLKRQHCYIRDASIHSEKPNNATSDQYIKSGILAPRIRWAGTMLVYLSHETCKSDYVNWEIEYAQRQGLRIVGVWSQGNTDAQHPDALDKYAHAVVGWRSDRILDAIRGRINNWENPDGTTRSERSIRRVKCQH
mgnify:CR=1 FL=1